MNIEVKYFGMTAEVTGKSFEEMELKEGAVLSDLHDLLIDKYPGLEKKNFKLTVDKKIAENPGGQSLKDGAEIALLPPFAGG